MEIDPWHGFGTGTPNEMDVVVVGSGAAGLVCALVAAVGGLRVLVVEKSEKLGGTSAMSGGAVWVPGNHHGRAAGVPDNPAEALAYLRATAPAGWRDTEDALWAALHNAGLDANTLVIIEAKHGQSPINVKLRQMADDSLYDGTPGFGFNGS